MKDLIQETIKVKKVHTVNVQGLNKPWIFLLIPVLAGSVWLVSNTWIITENINKPYILWAGPATIGSVVATWIIFNFFKVIISWCKSFWQTSVNYLKQPGSKFWIATSIFLTVSVLESGLCFGEILGESILYRALGYAVAVAIDSVSVICILARQGAVRRNDKSGTRLYMFGIFVCAGMSTVANGYITHEHYIAPRTVTGSIWADIAPILGILPPLLVVFLGFASDYTMDQAASKLDPAAYEEAEKNRIRFYEIQRDMLVQRKAIQKEINDLNGKTKPVKVQRVFRPLNWFFPAVVPPVDTKAVIALVVEELQKVSPAIEAPTNVAGDTSVDPYHQLIDDGFVDIAYDTTLDMQDDTEVQNFVNNQMTPRPKITVKLDDTSGSKIRNTDKLKSSSGVSTRKVQNPEGDAAKRIRRMIKRNPEIQPSEIIEKVKVTRQYASKIKAQVLNELTGNV